MYIPGGPGGQASQEDPFLPVERAGDGQDECSGWEIPSSKGWEPGQTHLRAIDTLASNGSWLARLSLQQESVLGPAATCTMRRRWDGIPQGISHGAFPVCMRFNTIYPLPFPAPHYQEAAL